MAKDCLFCKIANKEKKEEIVYEDDTFVAFPDANPQAPVHLLIIPKKHIGITGCDIEGRCEVSRKVFAAARKIAEQVGIPNSYRLLMNAGYSATESPDHLHIHLLGGSDSKRKDV
jgi:histidine triad (HIT) family protein